MLRSLFKLFISTLLLAAMAASVRAQSSCPGDVDGDFVVDGADIDAAAALLFDPSEADEATLDRTDANGDGYLSAADITAIAMMDGARCSSSGTPTPTRTATNTRQPTRTPTSTFTMRPTPTPTMVCSTGTLVIGANSGTLSEGDCTRTFRNNARFADEYTLQAPVGQAVRIAVTATNAGQLFTPYLRVIDSNGYFGIADGRSPIEFVSTTSSPYHVFVSSDPTTTAQVGSYSVSVSTRSCPTANLNGGQQGVLDPSECPAVFSPSRGIAVGSGTRLASEPGDVYTFSVAQPLTLVTITMSQVNEDSFLDPALTIIGPDGHELYPSFQGDDAAPRGWGLDSQARFLAVQPGSYTVIATGGGCDPTDDEGGCRYTLAYRNGSCNAQALTNIPSTGRKAVAGTLWGDPSKTSCAAPATIPGRTDEGTPEIGSPADVYTFQANAGEVITLEAEPDPVLGGEPILYLFGPAAAGYPLIAVDALQPGDDLAQIGVALAATGTYTVVVANQSFVAAPDPFDSQDEGESVGYTLFAQKCGSFGAINPGVPVSSQFQALDCVAKGDVPVRSYIFSGTADQFATFRMEAGLLDVKLALVAPDGLRTEATSDPFAPDQPAARVERIIPQSVPYVVEASLEKDVVLNPASYPSFTIQGSVCTPRAITPGTVADSFAGGDCDLGGGRRFDVFRLPTAVSPMAISVSSPANGCVLALLDEGSVLPRACSTSPVELPIAAGGTYGLIAAAASSSTSGGYELRLRSCPVVPITFAQSISGEVTPADCSDQAGTPADWVLFGAPEGLAFYTLAAGGVFDAESGANATALTMEGPMSIDSGFALDATELIPSADGRLNALFKVVGSGGYSLSIDPANRID